MKLIIDVPEEYYKSAKLMVEKGSTYPLKVSIANGIPLDDVKAEIVKAYDEATMYSCDEEVSRFASIVCGILNNIGKAESEEDDGKKA